MLFSLLMPLLCAVCFAVTGIIVQGKKSVRTDTLHLPKKLQWILPKQQTADTRFWMLAGFELAMLEIFIFSVLGLLVTSFTLHEIVIFPPGALLAASALPFAAALAKLCKPDWENFARFLKKIALCGLVLVIAEVLLFNGKSFTANPKAEPLTGDCFSFSASDALRKDGENLLITGDCSMILENIPQDTRALLFQTLQEYNDRARLFHMWLEMEDDNFQYAYQIVGDTYLMGFPDGKEWNSAISFQPYGTLHSMKLSFNQIANPVTLHGITAVTAIPYQFSGLRFFALLLGIALLLSVKEFGWYRCTYDRKNIVHRTAAGVVIFLCALSCVQLFPPVQEELTEYHADANYSWADPYAQTFHAFQNGRTYLEIDVDPELEKLQNPYDTSERRETGVGAAWDYAFYNGKYYSYFGVAPVLTYYAPYILLTGNIPSTAMANDFFAVLSVIFLCMTILAFVRLNGIRANLILLLASFPAVSCCTGAYFCMEFSDKYFVAIASALCYLSLTLWLGFWGCCVKKHLPRCILFAGSGLALALTVASRPGVAVCAAVLLPFFFGILFRKSAALPKRFTQAACFLLPLFAGMGGIMAYNAARFSSPLDFGAAYQLTVSNVHANSLRLSMLPAAFLHYFLQLPDLKGNFPYFGMANTHLCNYGMYLYMEGVFSAMMNPYIFAGVLLLPMAFPRKNQRLTPGVSALQKNCSLLLCFLVPVVLAWMDCCMGGLNQRYIVDIMPLLSLGSVLVLLKTTDLQNKFYRYVCSVVTLLASAFILWLMLTGIRDGMLVRHDPALYETAEDLLIFWH